MTNKIDLRQLSIRRLWQSDKAALVDLFQKMDFQTRRLRFCGAVSDDFLKTYAEGILADHVIAYGAFSGQELHGIAELRILHSSWHKTAEAALMVEPVWQEKGIGDALLDRLITASQNRNISSINMVCLRENKRMQHLAKKHDAALRYHTGETEAALTLPWPTPMSLFYEIFADTRGYIQVMFR